MAYLKMSDMFDLIPAIWIIKGKCVRLTRGDFGTEELISNNPLDLAKSFEDHGMHRLHLVDLDGARRGRPKNYHVLETIASHTSLKIDFSGGISTDGDVIKSLEHGAQTITASSVAVSDPEKFAQWIISYGREKLKLAADTDPGDYKIKINGWVRNTEIDLFEHIDHFFNRGLKYVKCSDISRDGVMDGPNFDLYEKILAKFPDLCLVASGGVRNVDDFKKLRELGLNGVVFGTAFYEKKITIKEIESFLSAS